MEEPVVSFNSFTGFHAESYRSMLYDARNPFNSFTGFHPSIDVGYKTDGKLSIPSPDSTRSPECQSGLWTFGSFNSFTGFHKSVVI